MAVKLNNFTLNTNFPAVAKMNSASRQCTIQAQSISSYQTVYSTVNIPVGSGEICEALIYVDNEYVPSMYFASGNLDGILYEYVVERVSAVQVKFTIAVTNYGNYTVSIPSKTASVFVSAFSVP